MVFLAVLLCLSFIPMTTFAEPGDVAINETNFPDTNFRAFVKQYDGNNDNVLQQSELLAVDRIYCRDKKISDLKGIEHFTALTILDCSKNKLTKLNVRNNTALVSLKCFSNKLTELDVSKNTALTDLRCSENQLEALDVGNNTALTSFECNKNKLTELDVSKNTALTRLQCVENALNSLNVRNNTALVSLECAYNKLTELDVSKNTLLTYLNFSNNQIAELDVSHNTALEQIHCSNNQFTTLDLSKNTALTHLYCDHNQLIKLDLSQNTKLWGLSCQNNQLTTLDLSNNPDLGEFECNDNQLTELKLCTEPTQFYFYYLNCSNNQLTTLDLSHSTGLVIIYCQKNHISALDLSAFSELGEINLANQSVNIRNTSCNSEHFIFNLTDLPGVDPAKIIKITKEDGTALPTGVVYDSASGTLKVPKGEANNLKKVKYIYDHSSQTGTDQIMDVTLSLEYGFIITRNPNNGVDNPIKAFLPIATPSYTFPNCDFTAPAGKEFKSWEVNGVEKTPNESVTVNEDTTVKAVWKDKAATANKSVITIDPAGGKWADGTTTSKTYKAEAGAYITLPAAPVKDGYTFLYWEGSRYNPGDKYKVTGADHKFTAVWQKKSVNPNTQNRSKPQKREKNNEVKTKKQKNPKTSTGTKTSFNGLIALSEIFVSTITLGVIYLNNKIKNAKN